MNEKQNSLDNLLRNSVEDSQFAFKEEYWDKMSALLDEEDKDKKRPFFWRWFSVLVAVLIVGGATYLLKIKGGNTKNQNSTTEIQNSTNQNTSLPEQVNAKNNETKSENINVENTNATDEVNNVATSTPAKKSYESDAVENSKNDNSEIVDSKNKNTNSENLSIKKEENTKIVNSNSENITTPAEINTVSEKTSNKEIIRNTKTTRRSSKTNIEKTSISNSKFQKEVIANIENLNSQSVSKTKKSKLKTETAKLKNQHPLLKTENTKIDNHKSEIVNINGKPMIQTSAVTYTQREPRDETIYNPRYNAALKDYVPEVYDSITILTYKPVGKVEDGVIATKPNEKTKTKEPFEPQPFNLFMLAGINMNKGFAGNVANELKWGYAPFVGAGFEKPIANKITMSSHVGFTYFNGLNTQKTVSGNSYSFGLDSSSISVYHKKMFQLYLPISIYYQLMKNHYLMGGVGASYALNVSSTYEELKGTSGGYNLTTSKPNTNYTTTTTNNQFGYKSGFNQFDIFIQAGYGYQAFRNLMFQIGVQQGLFDMTKNSFFNNTIKNTQTRFSLGIKYSFKRNND